MIPTQHVDATNAKHTVPPPTYRGRSRTTVDFDLLKEILGDVYFMKTSKTRTINGGTQE
eukprot:CAMPEP_0168570420 /NCGR_PEP_ID=MMETSP0413-20121227/16709_1 /TAXON_ID=136452 /ORGANISM="Filamoeba nolandi, Strain NC-AS-23-1" /LENGTH=58 /DNA_ID=CAMNT_0008603037 /DNA_START=1 /DNA_END=174 /DNA_ORIENTATION=+